MIDGATIDCGNSTVVCRRPDGVIWRTPSRDPDLATALLQLPDFLRGSTPRPTPRQTPGPALRPTPRPTQPSATRLRIAAVSVVPRALEAVQHACRDLAVVEVAGQQLPCPLRLDYETVPTLGADRWLGALAAWRRCTASPADKAVVTIDCGTATTVNVATGEPAAGDAAVFRGGAIAPGLSAFVVGMQHTAPRLPFADLDAVPAMPGRSTQASIDTGVLLGWVGMVERLVAAACQGLASPRVYATGGHAHRLLRHAQLPGEPEHVPELLHDGLLALLEAHP
ncbi:MAG: type III pantothenate kinase [Planctomycetota bacterium]